MEPLVRTVGVVVTAFRSQPSGEKMDEIGWKIHLTFLPLEYPKRAQSWWKIDEHENLSSYMPKNLVEIVFKPNFFR